VTEKLYSSKKYIEKGETVTVGEFQVTAFHVSHDSTDCVGYTIEYKGKRFTVATDLGHVGEEVAEHIKQADYLVLEANYDEQMMKQGPYPVHLQNRITADTGHLSNEQAGLFLKANYNERTQHIFLCHLSRENNLPEIAYTTIQNHLDERQIVVGKDVQLVTLDRMNSSELYIFE
jgi:phosphoribosyl 1,2-cyclic phosphodiesterase